MNTLLHGPKTKPKQSRRRHPFISNVCYFLYTANLIAVALLLFDANVASVSHFPNSAIVFAKTFTHVGKSDWILIVSGGASIAGFLVVRGHIHGAPKREIRNISAAALYIFVTVASSGLVANILKRMIGRARPKLFENEGVFSFSPLAFNASYESFPSGHATTAASLFVALSILAPRWQMIFLIAGIWVGLARIIVGAHYPSDVVAGLALGGWFAVFVAKIFAHYGMLFKIDRSGWPAVRAA